MIPVLFRTNIDCLKRYMGELPSGLHARPITGDYVTLDQRISAVVSQCVFEKNGYGMVLVVWLDMPDCWKGDLRAFEKHVKGR